MKSEFHDQGKHIGVYDFVIFCLKQKEKQLIIQQQQTKKKISNLRDYND